MKHLLAVTWARWTVQDPIDEEHYTIFTASILKPSWEYPIVCASMAIRKGIKKIFIRLSYGGLLATFVIPDEYRERLDLGYKEALSIAEYIQSKQRALHRLSNIPPGAKVIRTDTGEIIAEVEQYLKEKKDV